MNDFHVKLTCTLAKGYTVEDAETDKDTLGERTFVVEDCCCAEGACEKALDRFHAKHPIGVLDYVEIDTQVIVGPDIRGALEALLADHITMSKERWASTGRLPETWMPLPVQETAREALKETHLAP